MNQLLIYKKVIVLVKTRFELILSLALIGIMLAYTFVGIQKHYHFQTFGWDTAVFDQQLYLLTQGEAPYSSLLNMHGLGDHFQILTYILGFLVYLIWNNTNTLFILQSVLGCMSAVPLYLLGKTLFIKHVSDFQTKMFSAIIAGMYVLSVPFQALITDEFHNEPLVLVPLIFLFYFIEKRNWRGYWISLVIFLLNKEVFGLFSIPISLYLYLKTKSLKHAFATLVVGLGFSIFLITTLMPRLAGSSGYLHFKSGNTPSELIDSYLAKPSLFITSLFDSPAKQLTIASSLVVFGFLPIFAPLQLIAPVFSIALRFYDSSVPRLHEFNNHFAAPLIPLMAVAAVYGLVKVLSYTKIAGKLRYISILAALLLFTILYQDYHYYGPLNSLAKPSFYHISAWELDAHELIKQVPPGVVIATQNSLLPHLSGRREFYLLPEIGNAEYIAVDLTDGPNKFYKSDRESTEMMIQELISSNKYQIIWSQGKSSLLKRQ